MDECYSQSTLSVCMIVKNEEGNLARCLESMQGVADELIVVDTGSSDRTVEIARSFGAKVSHFTWQNDFSQARNVSLEKASCKWILYIDADEELETGTRQRIKQVLAESDAEGIMVTVRNFNPSSALTEYHDSLQVRIFRNRSHYRFEQSVHNQIAPSILRAGGKLAEELALIWWHYGYIQQTVQGNEDRIRRSLVMLEQAVNREPDNAYLTAKLGIIYFHLGEHSLAYSYCYRVLMELDNSSVGVELMKDVLRILSFIASNRGHYELAVNAAEACANIAGDDVDGQTSALDLMGQAYGGWGESHLRAAIEMEKDALWRENGAVWKENVMKSADALRKAQDSFRRLLNHPSLRATRRAEIEADAAHCQDLLNYIAKRESEL